MKEKISRLFANSVQNKKFLKKNLNIDSDIKSMLHAIQCLRLNIEVPYQTIEEEINSIPPTLFVEHRSQEYDANYGWKSFTLHGIGYNATREEEFYNCDTVMEWTEEAKKYCSKTIEYFQNFWPCNEFGRIRIMLLEPNSIINVHKDVSEINSTCAVNIAITQPKDCNFYLDNYGVIPFEPGSAFLINLSNLHTVINDSNQKRYHIIVHHKKLTEKFDFFVRNSYNKVYASHTNN